jgi:hypothetical protein
MRTHAPDQAMLAMDDTGALLRFVQRPNRKSRQLRKTCQP